MSKEYKIRGMMIFATILILIEVIVLIASAKCKIEVRIPCLTDSQGDVRVYERELFATGYAMAKTQDRKFASPETYKEYREKGRQIWDTAKQGDPK